MVPRPIAPMLTMLDGTRDGNALRTGFLLLTGIQLDPSEVDAFLQSLDDAFLLDNERFQGALAKIMDNYRSGPFRASSLAGSAYPSNGDDLREALDGYCNNANADGMARDTIESSGRIAGLISPHIDYNRGWRTYAETWQLAKSAVEDADLVILLGTDHSGSPGKLTLTRQDYATPWGQLPTDTSLVDGLVEILGEEEAFQEEVHHIGEHSVELASVWLHYFADGKPKRLLPILCGVDENLTENGVGNNGVLQEALSYLSKVVAEQNTLVVAAGDLSHVGPAFSDTLPLDLAGKARIRATDEEWLEVACTGSSERLAEHMRSQGDTTRICGASPIRYMLDILPETKGEVVAYDQCPADERFGSLVSIAGVLFTE
jgi:AmmeMemoRadiSam system protein B